MSEIRDLVDELLGGACSDTDLRRRWVARFAALSPQDRVSVVRQLRGHLEKAPSAALDLWEINFALRKEPTFVRAASEIVRLLDPEPADDADGSRDDDTRGRALRAVREWVEQRCRRGFIFDGSPGAWRPRTGSSLSNDAGDARPAPRHHIVSRGAWPSSRLVADTLMQRDDTITDSISVAPGERARRW